MNPVNPLRPGSPKRKKSSSGGIVMTIILVLALAGGGVVYHRISVQREAEAAELAARKEAEAKAARARKAAELEAARKAAEERARAEAAEKARLEAERLAAEEAARKRQKKEPEAVEPAPTDRRKSPWSGGRPAPGDFQKARFAGQPEANNANRSCLRMPFNLALETGRYDLYAGFLRSNLERDAVKVITLQFDVSSVTKARISCAPMNCTSSSAKWGRKPFRSSSGEFPQIFLSVAFSDPSDPLRLFLRTMARNRLPQGGNGEASCGSGRSSG